MRHSERTRSSLIRRLRDSDDKTSWLEFDTLYRPFLYDMARRYGLAADDADDLVQDVFTKVVGAIAEFDLDRGRGRFRGWLKTIAVRKLIDRKPPPGRILFAISAANEPAAPDPLEKLWDQEYRRHVLSHAMSRVRDQCEATTWTCFAECKLNGKPAAEVASQLGLSDNAVYQNVARTLERLRRQCLDYDEEPWAP